MPRLAYFCLLLASLVTGHPAWPEVLPGLNEPLDGGLEIGTSVAHSYEARNVFTNPAALGFESALNGSSLQSAFAFGEPRDVSFGLSWGYLGFGAERISSQGYSRYRIALGAPLSPRLFLGTRLSLFRGEAGGPFAGQSMDGIDVAAQFRPSPYWSLGAVLNRVNTPTWNGVNAPLLTTLALAIRPLPSWELTLDASTPADRFLSHLQGQAVVGWECLRGVRLRAGYHTQYGALVGLQMHIGPASLWGSYQPSATPRRAVVGFQTGTRPYATAIAAPRAVRMTVGSNLTEAGTSGSLLSPARPSLVAYLEQLRALEQDPHVTSVLVRLEGFSLGFAAAHGVHRALWSLREKGKQVEVYIGNVGMKEYLIASAASAIHMEPAAELRWLGLRQERYFLKGTLDKLGVQAELIQAGKYKSAPETFMRKSSSNPAKEAALEQLADLEKSLRKVIESAWKRHGRKPQDSWAELQRRGILGAAEARELGLVDTLGGFTAELARREKNEQVVVPYTLRQDRLNLAPRIAVVVASGAILPDSTGFSPFGMGPLTTPRNMDQRLQAAEQDGRTVAVVLRISSPGGEVLASQQIASRVEQTNQSKPVVVSMGDVAASGGYYIAAPATKILADELTITGSIGVFMGKFSLSQLYEKIDLKKEILTHAPYPGLFSEGRPWNESERAVMERRLSEHYDGFILHVSTHRKQERTQTHAAAQGRVWTGAQAMPLGLVDSLGGLREALDQTAEQAGLAPGEYSVWEIEPEWNFARALTENWGYSPALKALETRLWNEGGWLAMALQESPYLYFAPLTVPEG